jgi:hypothetical protein
MNMQKALVKTVGFAALLAVHTIWVAEAAAQQPPPIQGVTGTSGDAAGEEALGGLKKGTRVVVSDPSKSVKEAAGSIVALNLADRTISVRLSDDSIQTFRLSDEAVADADAVGDAGVKVIVYYRNESGQRIAKHFTRVS